VGLSACVSVTTKHTKSALQTATTMQGSQYW
jgi:hypothetical protein